MGKKKTHKRKPLAQCIRTHTRLCTTVQTLLIQQLGLDPSSHLENPLPIAHKPALKLLEGIACISTPTGANSNQLGGHAGDCVVDASHYVVPSEKDLIPFEQLVEVYRQVLGENGSADLE